MLSTFSELLHALMMHAFGLEELFETLVGFKAAKVGCNSPAWQFNM